MKVVILLTTIFLIRCAQKEPIPDISSSPTPSSTPALQMAQPSRGDLGIRTQATPVGQVKSSASPSPSPLPFWKAKPEVYRRIREERAVIVSAKTEDVGEDKKLIITTAGLIRVPVEFAHQKIMDFDSYSKTLPYIEETAFDKVTNNLYVHASFLKYGVKMTLHIADEKTSTGYLIHWESISGAFVGMKGTIVEDRTDKDQTEISMYGSFLGHSLGIPTFILQWGLEFAGHRAASAMRTHIEEKWAASSSQSK